MPLGALATGLLSGGASLLSGFGAASAQRKRDKANVRAMAEANFVNASRATKLNNELRQRADRAAKVPIVTQRSSGGDVDTERFIAQSEAMGINPITMVRSGSLGLWGRNWERTETTGENAMQAALAGDNIYYDSPNVLTGSPPQTTGQVLGGAFQDGLSAYSTVAQQDAQNAFQMRYLRAQQQGQAGLQAARMRSYGSLATGAGGGGSTGGGVLGSTPGKGLKIGGLDWLLNPNSSDAQQFENRLGEPGEWLFAPVIMYQDFKFQTEQMGEKAPQWRKDVAGTVDYSKQGWNAAAAAWTALRKQPVRVVPVPKKGSWTDYIPSFSFE